MKYNSLNEASNIRLELLKTLKYSSIEHRSVIELIDDTDLLYDYIHNGKFEAKKCSYPEKEDTWGYTGEEYDGYKDEVVSEKDAACEKVDKFEPKSKVEPWNTEEFKKEYNDIQKIGEVLFNTPRFVGENRTADNLYNWLNKSEELKEEERKVLYDMYDAASKRSFSNKTVVNIENIPTRSVPVIKKSELKEILRFNNISSSPKPGFDCSDEHKKLWINYRKAVDEISNTPNLSAKELLGKLRDIHALTLAINATFKYNEKHDVSAYSGKFEEIAKISREWDEQRAKKESLYGEQLEAHCQKDPLYKLYSEQINEQYNPTSKVSYFDQWSKERDEKLAKEKTDKEELNFVHDYVKHEQHLNDYVAKVASPFSLYTSCSGGLSGVILQKDFY